MQGLAVAAVLLAFTGFAMAGPLSGTAEVIDGDGLAFGPIVIRLHGVDAPEMAQHCAKAGGTTWKCGEAAADALAELIAGHEVTCDPLDRDAYGRIIARCSVDDIDIGAEMVSEGMAWAFVRYSADYVDLEVDARTAGNGIWQAETEPAWVYREDRWGRAVAEAPNGCPIKGNIARDGEHIYHTPWSPWYGRTKIDETSGERWFCDEAEAVAAGWRAARAR